MEKKVNIKIEQVLKEIRPYLQIDQGDIEFVRYEKETRVAEFRFLGNCKICPLSPMTLRGGIERFILYNVPEVRRIEAIQ